MSQPTLLSPEEILAIPVYLYGDTREPIVLRQLFTQLLSLLWEDGEEFSGKRPFGNSDWQDRVYIALGDAGAYVNFESDDFDYREADRIIQKAILSI